MASRACDLGRVQWNGAPVKPAHDVKLGDRLHIKNDSGEFEIDVLGLSEMRGPAAVAQTLYAETDGSKAARAKMVEDRKLMPHFETTREGRPNKRHRRELDRLRGR